MIGTIISHYRITAKLGEGGMGVVYRASDTKLQRDVALKLLPEELTADPSRRSRFQREAQLLAALNHPNIAAVYGIEDNAIVMELVEGPTLADRIATGPIPPDEALPIARQIADALEAAHEKGIIHRDLKPANIKLTPDGQVKVLDFGLAKAIDEAPAQDSNPANSPTLVAGRSLPGLILGTASYMSPEQARGGHVDKRTDIWAFGVVLYEMLTAKRLFEGETISDTLAQVLTKEPDLSTIPADLRPILERCLQRDRKQRLRDIGDAWLLAPPVQPQTSPGKSSRLWIGLASSSLAGVLLLAILYFRKPVELPVRRFVFTPESEFGSSLTDSASISPDGTRIAGSSGGKLWMRDLDQENARALDGAPNGFWPRWSPDGRTLAIGWMNGKAQRYTIQGGATAVTGTCLSNLSYVGSSVWSSDGARLLKMCNGNQVFEVDPSTGTERPLANFQARRRFVELLQWLPGGKTVLLQHRNTSYDPATAILLLDLATGSQRELLSGANAIYSEPGYLLYEGNQGGLWAVPFSLRTGNTSGEPVLLEKKAGRPSVSLDGTLVFTDQFRDASQLVVRDLSGRRTGIVGKPQAAMHLPNLSPDGTRIAVEAFENGRQSLWIHEVGKQIATPLPPTCGEDGAPLWTRDGKSIVFLCLDGNTSSSLARKDLDSNEKAVTLASSGVIWSRPSSLVPDGPGIIHSGTAGVHVLRPKAPGQDSWTSSAIVPLDGKTIEVGAQVSPDGRWLLSTTNESGQFQVIVRRYPSGGDKRQVSEGQGRQPRWSHDGSEIYFRNDRYLMSAKVEAVGDTIRIEKPQPLFEAPVALRSWWYPQYVVLPAGKGFVFIENVEARTGAGQIHIVQNWPKAYRNQLGIQ